MFKKYFLLLSILIVFISNANLAFANSMNFNEYMNKTNIDQQLSTAINQNTQNITQNMISGGSSEKSISDSTIVPYPYPNNGIYISISLITKATPNEIYVDGSYYNSNYSTAEEAKTDLKSKYENVKNAVKNYGTIVLNSMNVYPQSNYFYNEDNTTTENISYSGDLSLKVTLIQASKLEDIKNIMLDNGLNSWVSANVSEENIIDAEMAAVQKIKNLLAKKIKLYETLLDKKLTTLSSIDLYAWAGSNIDVEKNTVDLTINVNATYLTE